MSEASTDHRRWFQFNLRMIFAVVTLVGVCLGVVAWVLPLKPAVVEGQSQICARCRSIRSPVNGVWTIDYKTPTFATCNHVWEDGNSLGMDTPVGDGIVVLVRKGDVYGAFIPLSQSISPETLSYKWYFRPDGRGTFDKTDPQVQSGESSESSGRPIQFGAFSIFWSGHSTASGWLYYDHTPGNRSPIAQDDLRICVTSETDISGVDACNSQWIYKASLTDSGIVGGAIIKHAK